MAHDAAAPQSNPPPVPLTSIERPIGPTEEASRPGARFGSDVVAETLRALDIPYIALNPGDSYHARFLAPPPRCSAPKDGSSRTNPPAWRHQFCAHRGYRCAHFVAA
jgi:hypothetical protein